MSFTRLDVSRRVPGGVSQSKRTKSPYLARQRINGIEYTHTNTEKHKVDSKSSEAVLAICVPSRIDIYDDSEIMAATERNHDAIL